MPRLIQITAFESPDQGRVLTELVVASLDLSGDFDAMNPVGRQVQQLDQRVRDTLRVKGELTAEEAASCHYILEPLD